LKIKDCQDKLTQSNKEHFSPEIKVIHAIIVRKVKILSLHKECPAMVALKVK